MKVLEATDFYFPWIAGPAPFIRSLSAGLSDSGHEVIIACPSPTGPSFGEGEGPILRRVRTWPVPFGYNLRAGAPFWHMNSLVRSWRPDVVHIHHPFPISLAALAAAKAHRIPIVATNHTVPDCTLFGLRGTRLYRPATLAFGRHLKAVLGSVDMVTTPTATAAEMVRGTGFEGPILPISNGVDVRRFHPSTGTSSHDLPLVLYTGRLDAEKDMTTFVRAIPEVLKRCDVRFRIGGEGTDRARLERMVHEMGVDHRVEFSGYVSEEELPGVYQEADIYAISSPVELQSISTLEALASGLPAVAVNAGALPELVHSGVNGFRVGQADPTAFGEAIAHLALDPGLRREMGTRSREIAIAHSVSRMVDRYETVFQGLISEQARGTVARSAVI